MPTCSYAGSTFLRRTMPPSALPRPPSVGCHAIPSPAPSSSGARAAAELALLVDNSPTPTAQAR
jgi:hypothetical protein